jgi:integrase
VRLGERPAYTWDEAVKRWHEEAETRGREHDRDRLKWFDQYLAGSPLSSIDADLVQKLRSVRLAESSKSTANRYMALLRMILRKAWREWEWLDKIPAVPMYALETHEPRFLTRSQFAKLVKQMPPHMAALAEFSVETGLRMRNATGLLWSQLDLKRGILIVPASRAKSGETISIPLSASAVTIIKAQKPRHETHVFTYRGKPMDDCNGHRFKKAAAQAGVPWLRWHDLRHTWASWHIQSGTPPHVLQELGAWKSPAMVKRYGHLTVDHLRAFVEHGKGTARKAQGAK